MIRLLYFSQGVLQIPNEGIRDILETSQRNNLALGVTGVLVYGGGLFMQILEGPEAAVLRLYVKIIDDRRHTDCRILHISPAIERMFDNWSMGGIAGNPLEFQHVRDLQSRRLQVVQEKAFSDTMREFVGKLRSG